VFVPNLNTIRQAALLLFLGPLALGASETSLYDELSFLEEASKTVEVNLPGENEIKPKVEWIVDEVSTGQAGVLKKELPKEAALEHGAVHKDKKKLRYRSR
jgi:hypothetical protein